MTQDNRCNKKEQCQESVINATTFINDANFRMQNTIIDNGFGCTKNSYWTRKGNFNNSK